MKIVHVEKVFGLEETATDIYLSENRVIRVYGGSVYLFEASVGADLDSLVAYQVVNDIMEA